MSEFARINAARPGKIIAMLDVIGASARSNKATPDEVATLLAPVRECLGDFADFTSAPQRPAEAPQAAAPITRPTPAETATTRSGRSSATRSAASRRASSQRRRSTW
jgi:hypothetical protein